MRRTWRDILPPAHKAGFFQTGSRHWMADDYCEHLMRIILGFLSGVVGMLAGWAGLAFLVVALAGPDRDGGVAMGAFFNIGPLGAIIGFAVGIFLFVKIGLVARPVAPAAQPPLQSAGEEPASAPPPGVAVTPGARRISRPFAAVLLVILATVSMSYKARRRTVTLSMPGVPSQAWILDLPSDPDPTPGYTDWLPSSNAPDAIELNYRLTADR